MTFPTHITSFIDRVEDTSSAEMGRIRIFFRNGLQLSVIRGDYSHGGREGLFEIAPVNLEGDLDGSLLDEADQGDDVLGYLTPERVLYYINKLGKIGEVQ